MPDEEPLLTVGGYHRLDRLLLPHVRRSVLAGEGPSIGPRIAAPQVQARHLDSAGGALAHRRHRATQVVVCRRAGDRTRSMLLRSAASAGPALDERVHVGMVVVAISPPQQVSWSGRAWRAYSPRPAVTDAVSISVRTRSQASADARGINVFDWPVPLITSLQCRAARVLLSMGAPELAKLAGVGIATVKRFESGRTVQPATVEAIGAALSASGVTFLAEGDRSPKGGEGVRLTR